MQDIKLLETCKQCGDNLTLMESQRHPEGTLWAVKRCLKCGGHTVEEVVQLHINENIVTNAEYLKSRKIDQNDKGCCATDCPFYNPEHDNIVTHCSLYNQELFGFGTKTRCGECHNYD
jgi:hypothetical protein